MKDIVPENKRHRLATDEILAHQEGVRESAWGVLGRVLNPDSPLTAIAEQLLEHGNMAGVGDEQYMIDTSQHERRKRVIDHGFVENGQEVFVDHSCDWIQPCPAPSGEDDSLAAIIHLMVG